MSVLNQLLEALNDITIAQQVETPHNNARLSFRLPADIAKSNTVGSFDEFGDLLGEYLRHHDTSCISKGGKLPKSEAIGRAKELIERAYRRENGDVASAYRDAHHGSGGGVCGVLDRIAELLKSDAVQRYEREVFDRLVPPTDWNRKVALIRLIFERLGPECPSSIRRDQPERYAHAFEELVRVYVRAFQRVWSTADRY